MVRSILVATQLYLLIAVTKQCYDARATLDDWPAWRTNLFATGACYGPIWGLGRATRRLKLRSNDCHQRADALEQDRSQNRTLLELTLTPWVDEQREPYRCARRHNRTPLCDPLPSH